MDLIVSISLEDVVSESLSVSQNVPKLDFKCLSVLVTLDANFLEYLLCDRIFQVAISFLA